MENNLLIARILYEIAKYWELQGENPFKVNAFRNSANVIDQLTVPIESFKGSYHALKGIGKGSAAVIEEVLRTGQSNELRELQEKYPESLFELARIPGLGGKSVHMLYEKLGISTLEQLEQAIKEEKIRQLPGFGPKSEEKILKGIKLAKQTGGVMLGIAIPLADHLIERIKEHPSVKRISLAGSIRRMRESVKDIDIVLSTDNPKDLADFILSLPEVVEVVGKGDTKVSFRYTRRFQIGVDVRMVTENQFPSALLHFTGSKEHNVRLRQESKEKGWKLSEYGIEKLLDDGTATEVDTFDSEQSLYDALGMPYIPPEMREDLGEIEAAKMGKLPDLVSFEHYRGDLHTHSTWSDGDHPIREIAEAARNRGYEYMAVTDHSQSLKIAGGLTPHQLKRQKEEIDELNKQWDDFQLLAGVEMDILSDGMLDYPDEILKELDIVIGSVHSRFSQTKEEMTKRMVKAIENNHVDIIGHPTGRLINRRQPYALDMEAVFKAAADTGTVLELNANPNRLDLSAHYVKQAKEDYGITFSINTDAHHIEEFNHIRYGLATARKGWLEKKDVINTMGYGKLKSFLNK